MDQSDNLNCFFGCAVISDIYLFQEMVLNPCFIFLFLYFILSLTDKVISNRT